MVDLSNPYLMSAEQVTSEDVLDAIFSEEDEIKRARYLVDFQKRAKELGCVTQYNQLVKAYKKVFKAIQDTRNQINHPVENYTAFNYFDDGHELFCGGWIADDNGIRTMTPFGVDILACYHPILPIERLKNLETGEEHIKLAYRRNNKWKEITVQKDVIASANKITCLSKLGISVTSENAKWLVKYLADLENWNEDYINVQSSTSKLGWNGNDFIPFDQNIIFDGDLRFKNIFDSIHERGNYDVWMEHVLKLRQRNRIEIKMMLATSFASVLVGKLGVLPFFVDLWGETEGGKSVSLMLACSVWANPDESQYIGDFKTTDVALETRADMLNSFPMMLDDTSKVSSRIRDNFEGIVYDLCSGKGKSRSNKELGVNRENRWKMCIITNGERPLASYVQQGGAINRIIEVECGSNVYESPQDTADILKKNYGFAGKQFVEVVKEMDSNELKKTYDMLLSKLMESDRMQKQTMSMALVLLADKIATEYIFKDNAYIPLEDAKKLLIERSNVSDNQRCYEYLIDKISANNQRFDDETRCEKWGTINDGYAYIYPVMFNDLCESGGFSKKAFIAWADRNNLLLGQNGNPSKVKKINGVSKRCICLKLESDSDEFMEIDDIDSIPFE